MANLDDLRRRLTVLESRQTVLSDQLATQKVSVEPIVARLRAEGISSVDAAIARKTSLEAELANLISATEAKIVELERKAGA